MLRLIALLVAFMVMGLMVFATEEPMSEEQPPVDWFVPDAEGKLRPNWEAEKQQRQIPTDTIVFFYTGDRPLTPENAAEVLSSTGYLNVYADRFNSDRPDPYVKGQEVWSGHERNGRQVFYQYHWIIFPDGTILQLLHDDEVPWACGNWPVNCRAIAIAFVGDFSDPTTQPTKAAQVSASDLIGRYVDEFVLGHCVDIANVQVVGHRDVRLTGPTPVPGEWFYQGGREYMLKLAGYQVRLGDNGGIVPEKGTLPGSC